MESIIKLKNMEYKKSEYVVLKHIDFTLYKGDFLCIIGKTGSGKSSFGKMLSNSDIYQNKDLNIKYAYKKSLDYYDTLYEYFGVQKNNKEVLELAQNLELSEYLDYKPSSLSYGYQSLICLMEALLVNPDVLIVDSLLDGLSMSLHDKVLKFLKSLNHKKNITIIYITENVSDALLFRKIAIISDGTIVYNGTLKKSLIDLNIWKKAGLELPFEIELSKKLEYYGLVDEPIFSVDKLVDKLWK